MCQVLFTCIVSECRDNDLTTASFSDFFAAFRNPACITPFTHTLDKFAAKAANFDTSTEVANQVAKTQEREMGWSLKLNLVQASSIP